MWHKVVERRWRLCGTGVARSVRHSSASAPSQPRPRAQLSDTTTQARPRQVPTTPYSLRPPDESFHTSTGVTKLEGQIDSVLAAAEAAAKGSAAARAGRAVFDKYEEKMDQVGQYHMMMEAKAQSMSTKTWSIDSIANWYKDSRREGPDGVSLQRTKDFTSTVPQYRPIVERFEDDHISKGLSFNGMIMHPLVFQGPLFTSLFTGTNFWRLFNALWMLMFLALLESIRRHGQYHYFNQHMLMLRNECDQYLKDRDENSCEEELLDRYGWYYRWLEAVSDRKVREGHTERNYMERGMMVQADWGSMGQGGFMSALSSYTLGSWERTRRTAQLGDSLGLT